MSPFYPQISFERSPVLEANALGIRQVFWLSVPPTLRAFPFQTFKTVASCGSRPRSQQRACLRFPRSSLLSS